MRLAVAAVVGAAAGAAADRLGDPSLDGPYFTFAAHRLVGSAGLHVYADRGLQAGPWQLLWFVLVGSGLVFALVSGAAVAAGLTWAVRAGRRRVALPDNAAVDALVLVLALGWGVVTSTYDSGHPAELVVPALWGLAALRAGQGRMTAAGLALGFAAGWETWALLGVPVLLAAPQLRQALRSAAVAAGVALATYLPFVVVGPFRMGDVRWGVSSATLVHALAPGLTHFSWAGRLAQAVAVVAVGTGTVLALRRRHATAATIAWLVPAAILVAKIATDPQPRDYYWAPVTAALLVGAGLVAAAPARFALAAPALAVSVVLPLQIWPVELAALVLLLAAATLPARAASTPNGVIAPEPVAIAA